MCDQQTFQFFAELRDTEIEPNIWRRFQVDSHVTKVMGLLKTVAGLQCFQDIQGIFRLTLSHLISRKTSSSAELIRGNSTLLGLIWTT